MTELARPDYAVVDGRGAMLEMYCKVCGTQIADNVAGRMRRLNNYAELKMKFMDGSEHVTNLCVDCIQLVAEDKTLLKKMMEADIDWMDPYGQDAFMQRDRQRIGPRVAAVDTKRQGIL